MSIAWHCDFEDCDEPVPPPARLGIRRSYLHRRQPSDLRTDTKNHRWVRGGHEEQTRVRQVWGVGRN
jgi:hypothetical protein